MDEAGASACSSGPGAVAAPARLPHQRILLVEDNPGDALLACERLSEAPSGTVQVDTVTSLAAALAWLELACADAIVLDLNLSDSQGLQTLHRIKAAAHSAPVIVVSGLVDDRLRHSAMAAGAEDVLSKDETNSRLFVRSVLYVIERNRARQQHQRLQRLLDATPDAILVTGVGGTVRFANLAAETLFGHSRDALMGELLVFSVAPGESQEITLHRPGTVLMGEIRVVNIEWDGEQAQLASIRDLTARNLAEQLRERSVALEFDNQRIEQAHRAKSRFLATMSHEIRTPMNAVIGLSYLLERTALDRKQADLVGKIKVAGKSLLGIINNVLDLSKIEAAELQLERSPFDLAQLLKDLGALMSVQAQAKGLAFGVGLPAGLPLILEGDATRLSQVLTNLVSNALKFTEQGGVNLAVQAQHKDATVQLRFEVTDTGIGIAPETLGRLFQPFVQADTSTTRRFGGTGLGLSIVRELVTLMGGQVGVDSAPGVGSVFRVDLELPLGQALPAAVRVPHPAASNQLAGVRVLVVDDNTINQDVARLLLEMHGASVTLAGHGQDAVSLLLEQPQGYDVVLMDVQMPVLDGLDATRRIRSGLGLAQLPIVALTAGTLEAEQRRVIAAGMDDFISKPFEPDALVSCIRRHVPPSKPAATAPSPGSIPGPAPARPLAETAWPCIEGIDHAAVRRRLQDDQELFLQLLHQLLSGFADLALPGNPRAGDLKALAARLHNLKGSAGTLGARAVEQLAADAEAACRAGQHERAGRLLQLLTQALDQLASAAAGVIGQSRAAESAAVGQGSRLDRAALRPLLQLLRGFNLDALERFSALAPDLRHTLGQQRFATLRSQVDALRFAAAAETLGELERTL